LSLHDALPIFDDEHVGMVRILPGGLAELEEDAIPQRESTSLIGAWPVPADEVLVGVGLMELHHPDAVVGSLLHDGESKPAGKEGLSDPWRSLQDDSLPATDALNYILDLSEVQKRSVREDVLGPVRRGRVHLARSLVDLGGLIYAVPSINEPRQVLVGSVPNEVDEARGELSVSVCRVGTQPPDSRPVREEVPIARLVLRIPLDLEPSAVAEVLDHRSDRFDDQTRNRSPAGVEGMPVLLCRGGLDGDLISDGDRL